MSRTGRRPGAPDTREDILAAARRAFAARGYEATSLRSIAKQVHVDPALLVHYFGSKDGLFLAALEVTIGAWAAVPLIVTLPVGASLTFRTAAVAALLTHSFVPWPSV